MRRTDDPDEPTFESRLLRFLEREEVDERRSADELRSLSVEDRVLEGECIQGALLEEVDDDVHVFRVHENLSKFRSGDAVALGDGVEFDAAWPCVYGDFDAREGTLRIERDRFVRGEQPRFECGQRYVIDRRSLGLRGRLRDVVRSGFADERIAAVLEGTHESERDEGRHARAVEKLTAAGLHPSQVEAGAAAIGTESLALIQGPPGTGKTRLLAEILRLLSGAGCRIALGAFTHRAVDNVLLALRRLDPDVPLAKIGNPGSEAALLRRAGVRIVRGRGVRPPTTGVVAGTPYALAKLPATERFHYTVFDEAGQLPIPHAMAGMLLAKRWVFVGDHRQLSPVVTAEHADSEATQSAFERLHGFYGSHLLDTTWRMNDGVCSVVGELFYDGRLHSAPEAAGRRMPFTSGGALDEVLDPEKPVVLARVDHLQPGKRSVEEARLCADLVAELRRRHGLEPKDLAVVAPFRAQVRAIRSALQEAGVDSEELVVDTVERVQGQEREVVILSLAVGDPATLDSRSKFFFSTNRLNVALSRARTKSILVASRGAFGALPPDPESLYAVAVFKQLARELPCVDLTAVYGGVRE